MRKSLAVLLVLGAAAPAAAQSTNGYDSLAGAFFLSSLQKQAASLGLQQGGGGSAPSYSGAQPLYSGYAQQGYDQGPTPEQLYQLQLMANRLGQINASLEQAQAMQEAYGGGYDDSSDDEGNWGGEGSDGGWNDRGGDDSGADDSGEDEGSDE